MKKRFAAIAVCLGMMVCLRLPAQADVATLDRALSRWLTQQNSVRTAAALEVKSLLPFDETTVALLNGVLKHVTLDISLTQTEASDEARVGIQMDGAALADFTQKETDSVRTLTTSLLPNRSLTSKMASPMDLLANPANENADSATSGTAEETAQPETTDIREAFTMLDAVTELQTCYQALTGATEAFTTEKRANYTIKGIGSGKWSRVARLTAEQCDTLAGELRAVLSCGMDAVYRAEIAQATFAKGFVVALYRNADQQDLCVYLKGTMLYADGSKRQITWQWAFTTNGLKRKDQITYKAAVSSGTADTRTISATATQESLSDSFSLTTKEETTLKRAKTTEKSTVAIDLSGKRSAEDALPCRGEVSRTIATTLGSDTARETTQTSVDLLFSPEGESSVLTGTVDQQTLADKAIQQEISLTFTRPEETAATVGDAAETTDESEVTVIVTSPDGSQRETGKSSLEMLEGDTAEQGASTEGSTDYLVGSAPIGLTTYHAPQTLTSVDLDAADAQVLEALLTEAAQNLASKLIPAIAALPAEDAGLLKDGMTDQDYAAFVALLGEL